MEDPADRVPGNNEDVDTNLVSSTSSRGVSKIPRLIPSEKIPAVPAQSPSLVLDGSEVIRHLVATNAHMNENLVRTLAIQQQKFATSILQAVRSSREDDITPIGTRIDGSRSDYGLTQAAGRLKMPSRSTTDSEDHGGKGRRSTLYEPRRSGSSDVDSDFEPYPPQARVYRRDQARGRPSSPPDMDAFSYARDTRDTRPYRCRGEREQVDHGSSRRHSVLQAVERGGEYPRTQVMMTQVQPSFEHIRLDKISCSAVLHFVDSINEYQAKHGVALPIANLLATGVREQLIAQSHGKVSHSSIFEVPPKVILRSLHKMIRPIDRNRFERELIANTSFPNLPQGYNPTAVNFKPFYNALLLYRSKFMRVFNVLAERNEQNIPRCDNKEGGLIKTFIDRIPFKYGSSVHKLLHGLRQDHIEDYLSDFFDQVEKDYLKFRSAEQVAGRLTLSDSAAAYAWYNAKQTRNQSDSQSRQSWSSAPKSTSGNRKVWPPRSPQKSDRAHNLHAVVATHTDNEEQVYESSDSDLADDEAGEVVVDDDADMQQQSSTVQPAADDFNAEEDEERMHAALHQLTSGKPTSGKSNRPNGCFQKLMFDACDRAVCTYSHNRDVLLRTHAYYQDLLDKSPYKPRMQLEPQLTSPVVKTPPNQHSVRHIHVPRTRDNNILSWDSEEVEDIVHNILLRESPETAVVKAVYCSGHVSLPSPTSEEHKTWTAEAHRVLFDSGAVSSSYVSMRWLKKHAQVLQQYLCESQGTVNLAVKGTTVDINHTIPLNLQFVDSEGVSHSATLNLVVLDTHDDTDIIVGMLDILRHFAPLQMSMWRCALDTIQKVDQQVSSISDATPSPQQTREDLDEYHYPWRKEVIDVEAPEDISTDLPASFTYALHFLEMQHADAILEFHKQFDSHVAAGFSGSTNILDLLRTKGSRVFVPQNWNGIRDIPALRLDWKPGLPDRLKPKARPINPRLMDAARKEFDRLQGYFYRPSTSPIASCLVIAPKATQPFIRFCGDYVAVNKYINVGHYPIPFVQKSLDKIIKYNIFLDFDLANAFHQVPLHPETSARLSVQTPWGQVEPRFMPEGIGPASGHLQKVVCEIFQQCEEWSIIIFDNLLVLAEDYDDAYKKCETILDICIARNVYLKFSKTWLGFSEVQFFGYLCRHKSYELTNERKAAIDAMAFPKSAKIMQSFLGTALFFKSFVPHYSTLTAPLHDTVRSGFDWRNKSSWTEDYEAIFSTFKEALKKACALYYPDYDKTWILRTDASLRGVGAVLFQVDNTNPLKPLYQPIGFASSKFSPQATRWSTLEQECYAIYHGVKSFAYYLSCKDFIMETDHNNLLWMEASAVPKIIRWRVYLQSFSFLIRHIPGKQNSLADWLSRMSEEDLPDGDQVRVSAVSSGSPTRPMKKKKKQSAEYLIADIDRLLDMHSNTVKTVADDADRENIPTVLNPPEPDPPPSLQRQPQEVDTVQDTSSSNNNLDYRDTLRRVHGGRMGHMGARRTWGLLNAHYPGHRIPYRLVEEFVSTCPLCQKLRLGLVDTIEPAVKSLAQDHHRAVVGVDTLTVTPVDKRGNRYIVVLVNHLTKFVQLYPVANHDARTTAECIFTYCCTYGLFDTLQTDPGSEFDNDIIRYLTEWFGIRHRFSLVDRHQSNGVEGSNKQILRHLSSLVHDERIIGDWSSPYVLPLIQYILNSAINSESGVVPLHAHFGSADDTYMKLPDVPSGTARTSAYLELLDRNLATVRAVAADHAARIRQERTKDTPVSTQNQYQQGDLILHDDSPAGQMKAAKLLPRFSGPYEVNFQSGNDITCKHLVLGQVKVLHVTRVKLFSGSREEAFNVALLDGDQHRVDSIVGYRGDPLKRRDMDFLVKFADGDTVWTRWSKDITDTLAFEDFVRSCPGLQLLVLSKSEENRKRAALKKQSLLDIVTPGKKFLADLRSFGHDWYDRDITKLLPNPYTTIYLVPHTYGTFKDESCTTVDMVCDLSSKDRYDVQGDYVHLYGNMAYTTDIILPNKHTCGMDQVLVTPDMVRKYPQLFN